MCLETIFHLLKIKYISSYKGFNGLQYVNLQLDLQKIRTCKCSKNYNMWIYNLIYKELQLGSGRIFFQIIVSFKNCHNFILICASYFGSLLFVLYSSGQAAMSRALSRLHIVIFSKQEVLRRQAARGSSGENKWPIVLLKIVKNSRHKL